MCRGRRKARAKRAQVPELVDSPVRRRYRARGAGCAAGPPPQRWWPRRCRGQHLQAGPCQAAGHGLRPPAVPKHREELCDTTARVTPLPPAQPLGGHGQADPLPTPAHGTRKLLGLGISVSLGHQHHRCEESWLVRGRQAEETAGKVPKNCSSHGKSKPLQALIREHVSTGEGSSWKGQISPGEGNYR